MLRLPTATLFRQVGRTTRTTTTGSSIGLSKSSISLGGLRCHVSGSSNGTKLTGGRWSFAAAAASKQQQQRMVFQQLQGARRNVNYYINPLGLKSPFKKPSPQTIKLLKTVGKYVLGGCVIGQICLGYAEDFFDYRFVIKADPTDLQDFFGTEAAMEVYSILPFVTSFLMRRGAWDDEGVYRVPIILGDYLSARIDFDEREQVAPPKPEIEKEVDEDDDEEEEDEGPKCEYFVKKERFRFVETHIGRALCDYSIEMGFNLLEKKDPNQKLDECEVFFKGTHFHGLFLFRIVFEIQGLFFFWGMQQYFNSNFFAEEDLSEEAEHYRLFVPLAVFKEYLYDLKEDVQGSLDRAKAANKATKDQERNIEDIKGLLAKAGYVGAEAVLMNVDDENGKQQILLNLKDKRARAIIQRALTFNAAAKKEQQENNKGASAGVNLARKMTMRIVKAQRTASKAATAVVATSEGSA